MLDQNHIRETDLPSFVTQLWNTGFVAVSGSNSQNEGVDLRQRDEAWSRIVEFAELENDTFPGTPPKLSRPAGEWALIMLWQACGYFAHREHSPDEMRTVLNVPCPEDVSPSVCWSVDLSFRHLPELARLVTAASLNDPLLDLLRGWGREWPLSSVGMACDTAKGEPQEPRSPDQRYEDWNLTGWWGNRGLRTVYLDRIFAREDLSRLNDPRVAIAARATLGDHPELCPRIADFLMPPSASTMDKSIVESK